MWQIFAVHQCNGSFTKILSDVLKLWQISFINVVMNQSQIQKIYGGGAIDNIITWGGVLGSFRLSVTSIFVIVLGDI